MLYPLVDNKCLFQSDSSYFAPKESLTMRDALVMIMNYYKVEPEIGTSPFLDIPIGDVMQ